MRVERGALMKITKFACVCLLILAGGWRLAAQNTGSNAEMQDVRSRIVGVWRGRSICVDKKSACHDEINVYRFSRLAGRPSGFSVTASKVVDGKEIVMGSAEWKYDEKTKVVESESHSSDWLLRAGKWKGS